MLETWGRLEEASAFEMLKSILTIATYNNKPTIPLHLNRNHNNTHIAASHVINMPPYDSAFMKSKLAIKRAWRHFLRKRSVGKSSQYPMTSSASTLLTAQDLQGFAA